METLKFLSPVYRKSTGDYEFIVNIMQDKNNITKYMTSTTSNWNIAFTLEQMEELFVWGPEADLLFGPKPK